MAGYLHLFPASKVARTIQVADHLMVDIGTEGNLVGIETVADGPVDEDDLRIVLRWVSREMVTE